MTLIRTDAVLLKAIRFGDTSTICRLFTRQQGVVAVMARASRRPRSPFAGALEPFRLLHVMYYSKESREVQTLSAVEVVDGFPDIGASLERMDAAGRWFRLLRSVLPDHAPATELFELVTTGLARLAATPVERTDRWEAYHRLAAAGYLGIAPELGSCVACGRDVGAVPVFFSIVDGGVVCSACADAQARNHALTSDAYAHLALYEQRDYSLLAELPVSSSGDGTARRLIREFVGYHTGVSRRAS